MKQKVGIWGFGTVGKSALKYFLSQHYQVAVLDQHPLSSDEENYLKKQAVPFFNQSELSQFLQQNDAILASPGIDLRPYAAYKEKWINELDIFGQYFKKPIVAITGTVGKTTVTHLLSELLKNHGVNVWTGGNIGRGMLDALEDKEPIDLAVLEVSSFQLEQCKTFAPDVAIWTNFSENHLDRHDNLASYFEAKKNILARQKSNQLAIIPSDVFKQASLEKNKQKIYCIVNDTSFSEQFCNESFFIKNNCVMRHKKGFSPLLSKTKTYIFEALEKITFKENRLLLSVALDAILKSFNKKIIKKFLTISCLPPHRLESVPFTNDIDIYNDSKATTHAATIAAVDKLCNRPLLLFLGGKSKGTKWEPLIMHIKNRVKKVYAFGAESAEIHKACLDYAIPCQSFSLLKEATTIAVQEACPGDQLLLSPGGTSFDLFNNYQERGDHFKKLIKKILSEKIVKI